jgi:uncharacterized membrane protein/predicted DsbA family dithiol-disulfide isomerase
MATMNTEATTTFTFEAKMPVEKADKKKAIQPLAFGMYYWVAVALAVVGILDSTYLAISHYRIYTDIGYESFCAISRAINCDTVSQSPYAIFVGLPVPVWGVLGYVFVLMILILAGTKAAQRKRIWALLFAVSLFYSVYSVVLAIISLVYIHSYCIMCILSYGINFMLLYYCWLIRRRFDPDPYLVSLREDLVFLLQNRRLTASVLAPFAVVTIILWTYFPVYWKLQPPVSSDEMSTGFTQEGFPWIGSENADIVITEFTDYLCFQCNKMHHYLRKLLTRYPGKIKIIHRQFPMDSRFNPIVRNPFHEGSGALSLLAVYAGTEGKFWQISDYLFANARKTGHIDLRSLAETFKIDYDKLSRSFGKRAIWLRLHKDIMDGIKLGVTGTPAFLIDGKLYSAQIPPEILSRVMD